MKKSLFVISLLTASVFAAGNFSPNLWNRTNGQPKDSYTQKVKTMKMMYKIQQTAKLKSLELQQKVLETKIKMLKQKIKLLTTTPKNLEQESVLNYTIDPNIIVKTIDYSAIRKKPVYMGLLMYYESEKMLSNGSSTNPADKILFSLPLGSGR